MKTKLKITEGQLKKLIERRHSYMDNSPEGEEEPQESNGADSAIITLDKEVEESKFNMGGDESKDENSNDKMIDVLKKAHTFIMDNSDNSEESEELCSEIEGILSDLGVEGEEEVEDIPGFEGTMDDLNNLSIRGGEMNESINSIKANFKRFL